MHSVAIVTGLFQKLAEFVLANQENTPGHPLIVLEDDFEYTDGMEEAARKTLRTVFGVETPAVQAAAR
jgi:hypothetical protein